MTYSPWYEIKAPLTPLNLNGMTSPFSRTLLPLPCHFTIVTAHSPSTLHLELGYTVDLPSPMYLLFFKRTGLCSYGPFKPATNPHQSLPPPGEGSKYAYFNTSLQTSPGSDHRNDAVKLLLLQSMQSLLLLLHKLKTETFH